ncbi:acetyltransferase [Microthyrium microscopicum]|uniref:Acetyltransferase n=1 Tax=Microthyrium microscopicum TaxID=703497 RepID=A0A6A6U2Q4_9PEZI|nr:acetyltransferase [Microthyrium microscopicum]
MIGGKPPIIYFNKQNLHPIISSSQFIQTFKADAMETFTSRLHLREFLPTDVTLFYSLESIPAVVRYQTWEPKTEIEAANYVFSVIGSQTEQPRTIFDLIVERKDSKEFLGRVGMKVDHDSEHGDLWFSFLPSAQGKGYAVEAVEGLLGLIPTLHTLGIECDPRNIGSRKLAERLNFEQVKLQENAFECKGEWVGSVEYIKTLRN